MCQSTSQCPILNAERDVKKKGLIEECKRVKPKGKEGNRANTEQRSIHVSQPYVLLFLKTVTAQ